MAVYVVGLRDFDKDSKFEKFMRLKLLCEASGVSYPSEVSDYFGVEVVESEDYIREEMEEVNLVGFDNGMLESATKMPYKNINQYGYDVVEIKISDIPKDITRLRIKYCY